MDNLIESEDEYKIIFYNTNIDSEAIILKENKSISFFSEFEEMLRFCESLETSFVVIFPNDEVLREEKLLKELKKSKDIYKRRLVNFEEEFIINKNFTEKSLNASIFYTRKDFEDEVLTKEEMRLDVIKMTEPAKDFCEELILWESNPKGQLDTWGSSEILFEKDHLECKEWCLTL